MVGGGEPCALEMVGTSVAFPLPIPEWISLGHCKAVGSRLKLEGDVRGWKIQVVMGEASKHKEPDVCG